MGNTTGRPKRRKQTDPPLIWWRQLPDTDKTADMKRNRQLPANATHWASHDYQWHVLVWLSSQRGYTVVMEGKDRYPNVSELVAAREQFCSKDAVMAAILPPMPEYRNPAHKVIVMQQVNHQAIPPKIIYPKGRRTAGGIILAP